MWLLAEASFRSINPNLRCHQRESTMASLVQSQSHSLSNCFREWLRDLHWIPLSVVLLLRLFCLLAKPPKRSGIIFLIKMISKSKPRNDELGGDLHLCSAHS